MQEKSKRILIFSTNYLPHIGGAELAVDEITKRITGVDFDLITSRLDGSLAAEERIGNVSVFRVGNPFVLKKILLPKILFPIAAFLKARDLAKRFGAYDAIFALQASSGGGGAWLYKIFNKKIPFFLNIQEGKNLKQQGWLINFFRNLIIKKADKIIVISHYLKKYVEEINKKAEILVIPNGVDMQKFSSHGVKMEGEKIRNKMGIKLDERVVITVSRLVPKNGIEHLIDAFNILNSKFKIQNLKLLIIGDGSLKENLKSKVESLNLGAKISFTGSISPEEIPAYLAGADVFVRPSLSEGLGTAFLEAMAAGTPVIGTRVGGIPDFLQDGKTGLFCEAGSPNSIADKIEILFSHPELRNQIIKNARELVSSKYNWDNIAEQYKKFLIYENFHHYPRL